MPTRVLFVCAANAARSPMAEALLRSLGGGEFEVQSAGVRPRDRIHPLTTRVLSAIHLDVSTHMTYRPPSWRTSPRRTLASF